MAKRGRPTKYSDEMIGKATQYLHIKRPSRDEHGQIDEVMPSIEGLALHLMVHRDTIWQWCKEEDKKDFSDIVEAIFQKQGKTLVNQGAIGNFNPTISKLLLSKHNYREQTEIDLTSGGEKLETNVINVIDKVYGNQPTTPVNPTPGRNS